MNQNIITYLSGNKEKYPKEVLVAELRKSGYSEGDITEGVAQVFDGKTSAVASVKTSFWNFREKKIYTSAGQKWADFLFGFFGINVILGTIFTFLQLLPYAPEEFIFSVLMLLVEVLIAIHVFSRRRFVFYGVIIFPACILPLVIILFISAIFGGRLF
jgi:hypothetical protein